MVFFKQKEQPINVNEAQRIVAGNAFPEVIAGFNKHPFVLRIWFHLYSKGMGRKYL